MEKETTNPESLKEFFSLMDSAFSEKKKSEQEALERSGNNLSEFFSLFQSPPIKEEIIVEEKPTLNDFFALVGSLPKKEKVIEEVIVDVIVQPETIIDDMVSSVVETISKEESNKPETVPENYINFFNQPDVNKVDPNLKSVQNKIKFLEDWMAKISLAGPGGGSGSILDIDKPAKTVYSDYTLTRKDYYIGVNCPTECTITLPDMGTNVYDGRIVIIKDESSNAQNNFIHILGTIDNDPGGAIIQSNNVSLQLLYNNNSWRIV